MDIKCPYNINNNNYDDDDDDDDNNNSNNDDMPLLFGSLVYLSGVKAR